MPFPLIGEGQIGYPKRAIRMIIQIKLFPQPQPPEHPSLHPFPKSEFPKIPPSPPHAHERMRSHKSTLQLQLPFEPVRPHPVPHPHDVAAKSLILFPPVISDYINRLCKTKNFVT